MTTNNSATVYECFKCDGKGNTPFTHIAGGACFTCGGTGRLDLNPTDRQLKAEERRAIAAARAIAARATIDNVSFIGPNLPFAARVLSYDYRYNQVVFAATLAGLRSAIRAALPSHSDYSVEVHYNAAPGLLSNGFDTGEGCATWHGDGTGMHEVAEKIKAAMAA